LEASRASAKNKIRERIIEYHSVISANKNQSNKSVAQATRGFGRPQIKLHVSGHDGPVKGKSRMDKVVEELQQGVAQLAIMKDPKKGATSFDERIGGLGPTLLLTDPVENDSIKTNQSINDNPQPARAGSKALTEQHGQPDFVQGCCFPYDQRCSGLGAPARENCAIDPSSGNYQGMIERYGTFDQSMDILATDDSKEGRQDEST
jgi:hypothetical protein